MSRSDVELATPYAKLLCLALGQLFLGRQELAEATTEVARWGGRGREGLGGRDWEVGGRWVGGGWQVGGQAVE